jgi:hypothetical protein
MKRAIRQIQIITLLLLAFTSVRAQFDFFPEVDYKEHPDHFHIGFGTSNFLGDLGGKNGIGTNDFRDLEVSQFNFATMMGYRHAFLKNLYGRADFAYGKVSGSDGLTKEGFRNNRNLNFKSNIVEVDAMAELWILIKNRKGHQYDLERVEAKSGPWKIQSIYMTVFGGLGLFHFNPKAYCEGEWIALQPLHTEGQGLPGGPKEYKLWQVNIPVGVSLMMRLHKQMSFGLEASYRYTFTDYIDDCSTKYYNPSDIALAAPKGMGDVAAYLSNPALGVANGGKPNYVTAVGQQRGDSTDRDGYFYIMLKMDYWFTPSNRISTSKGHKGLGLRKARKAVKRGAL